MFLASYLGNLQDCPPKGRARLACGSRTIKSRELPRSTSFSSLVWEYTAPVECQCGCKRKKSTKPGCNTDAGARAQWYAQVWPGRIKHTRLPSSQQTAMVLEIICTIGYVYLMILTESLPTTMPCSPRPSWPALPGQCHHDVQFPTEPIR
jgi:hypothetical protein